MCEKRLSDLSPVSPMHSTHVKSFHPEQSVCGQNGNASTDLRTGIGRCKVLLHKWGYLKDDQDLNCDCGSELHTMQHLLQCPLLEQVCTAEDLAAYNDTAQKCSALAEQYLMLCGFDKKKLYTKLQNLS